MYEAYYLTLPGGLTLPVALIKETLSCWETEIVSCQSPGLQAGAENFARGYLKSRMIAGTLERQSIRVTWLEDACRLEGTFHCVEMIGRQRTEQIGEEHE